MTARRHIAVIDIGKTNAKLALVDGASLAEIAVTTNGGPGTATTTITYQVALQSLYDNDVGGASAGGIVAVILANIVAIFVMRMIGKNLDA